MSPSNERDMRAAVLTRFGDPDAVRAQRVPRPTPGPNDVLIRVHASTVSVADYRSRTRRMPRGLRLLGPLTLGVFRPRRRVLGMDFAGVVEAVGTDVTRFTPGDDVIAYPGVRLGGHAEYAVMPADGALARKPEGVPMTDATAMVFGGVTVLRFFRKAVVVPGAEVLVNGGSGAIGAAAIQWAKAMGARVTAVSSAVNHDFVRQLGADHAIDYATADFADTTSSYDVIVDAVGNAPFRRVDNALRPGGALLSIVGDLRTMLTARRDTRRTGKTVVMLIEPATASDLEELAGCMASGQFRPVVERVYALDEIAEAHRRVESRRKRGNLVLGLA